MTDINQKQQDNDKKIIDSAVARVSGAVRVANVAVGEVIEIKDEALDDVEALKTGSNAKAEAHAVKKIKTDTKKVLGKSK
jgi:hypothetical protein